MLFSNSFQILGMAFARSYYRLYRLLLVFPTPLPAMHMKFAELWCYVCWHDTKAKCYFLFSLISLHIIIHHPTILIICSTNVLKNNPTCLISPFNHELQLLKIEKLEKKTSKERRSPIIFFLHIAIDIFINFCMLRTNYYIF